MNRDVTEPDERTKSLVLLVSDALAFTEQLTERKRQVLVDALRHAATKPVTDEDERYWFSLMLDVELQVTAYFDSEVWKQLESRRGN